MLHTVPMKPGTCNRNHGKYRLLLLLLLLLLVTGEYLVIVDKPQVPIFVEDDISRVPFRLPRHKGAQGNIA